MTYYKILKQYFGYDTFRGGQEELIKSILEGRDTLGVMPTGAGKSICFQIPALMSAGITLIISPLISLMKDQVNALTQAGIASAFINSSLNERQISAVMRKAADGAYKMIYIAPERLMNESFLQFARNADIPMVTVDEAHCISQWGQDFRPSYLKIPEFLSQLAKRPTLSAFTATATPKVREDIVASLKLEDPKVLVTGFDRSNLYFEVRKPKDKFACLTDIIKDRADKNGIIYCSTRNNVEEVCRKLNEEGYSASRYHAGLSDEERRANQDDFLFDRVKIMVATNAFGMGIDKSDIAFVIHYNMPKDIESYYQEAGRAGRDGENADCILLYSGQDVRTQQWLIENGRDSEYSDSETEKKLKELERKRLKEMTFYCTTSSCLRSYILKYFGEDPPHSCGNCGNCNADFETSDITVDAQKILSCVARMNGRYGVNMVTDVLRGSKNEKIIRLGLNDLSTYNISEKTDKQLKSITNYLIMNGYLAKTDDEFPRVILGKRAKSVLYGGESVYIKLPKKADDETIAKKKKRSGRDRPSDDKLFEELRMLRRRIADEQDLPAFVIFSDSTLVDMCARQPKTREEMLDVSGVGKVKLERYGEEFLQVIRNFAD